MTPILLLIVSLLGINQPATADAPAVRLDVPVVSAEAVPPAFSDEVVGTHCVGLEPLLAWYSPGWDVRRMSHYAWRESRCHPTAYNRGGRAHGLLQITPITFGFLAQALDEPVTSAKLFDPVFNVRAAAALYREDGYAPWAL